MVLPVGLAPPWRAQAAPGPSSQRQPGTGTSRMQPSPSQPGPWCQCLSPELTFDKEKGMLTALKHLLIHPLCSQDVVMAINHSNPGFVGGPGTEMGPILDPAGLWGEREQEGQSLLGQQGHDAVTTWGCPQPQRGSQHLPCPAPSTLGLLCAGTQCQRKKEGDGGRWALHKVEILRLQGEVASASLKTNPVNLKHLGPPGWGTAPAGEGNLLLSSQIKGFGCLLTVLYV